MKIILETLLLILLAIPYQFYTVDQPEITNLSQKQSYFKHQILHSARMHNEVKITYYVGEEKMGFISYAQLPLLSWYVIHSFYIYPKYRQRGFGQKLLEYACLYLQMIGAKKIYVQPGPFEIINSNRTNIPDAYRKLKLQQLVKLYKKHGFEMVNKITSTFAYMLYKLMDIDENSDYLMVKKL